MSVNNSIIGTTINELVNLLIISSAQVTTQSLKEANLSIRISDRTLDGSSVSSNCLYSQFLWNSVNLVDDIIDVFANAKEIHTVWIECYKASKCSHAPQFKFVVSYKMDSILVRNLTLLESGIQMHESRDYTNVMENSLKIILPSFVLESSPSETEQTLSCLKSIFQIHSIINPKLSTIIEFSHQGCLKEEWKHTRVLCPFNYHQLGRYFTNDINCFFNSQDPNSSNYIFPPNYRRLTKPQSFCIKDCSRCRWKIFYLGCVYPPLKNRNKLIGSELLDVNILLIGPNSTIPFSPGCAPILTPNTWAKWNKFNVKLNLSNLKSRIINSQYYLNSSENKSVENSLILVIGFELDSPEKVFTNTVDSLRFLSNNLTDILEENSTFIQSSCESLISKLLLNQTIIKSKLDDSFLLRELGNAVNSIIVRSKNPEVKADYMNTLDCDEMDKTQDILERCIFSLFEKHLESLENKSQTRDKRTNVFTPSQPKRQITEQAFDDLENFDLIDKFEETSKLDSSFQLHSATDQLSPFSFLGNSNLAPRGNTLKGSQHSDSLLKSPLFDTTSLPCTSPKQDTGYSQNSSNLEFNALAEHIEFSSPVISPDIPQLSNSNYKKDSTLITPKTHQTSNPNIETPTGKLYSQNSRTDNSQDYKLLCNEDVLFLSSSPYKEFPLCEQKSFISNSSQGDFEQLKNEF